MIMTMNEDVTESSVKEIRDLAESSIGPYGRLKVLQTTSGGYAMMTSTSSRLFDFMEAKEPISQILLAGFAAHQYLFKNAGLFLAALTCNFYVTHCASSLPRNMCIEINNYVHERIRKKLEEKDMTRELDIGKVSDMLALVKSILQTKPACQLSEEELDHLSITVLKAFFMNTDSEMRKQYGLITIPLEGPSTFQTHLISGIVLQLPMVDFFDEKFISCYEGCPTIVLVSASLAGDQQVINESALLQNSDSTPLDDVTFGIIWELVESFVSAGVNIVCCQKVIHPSVRKFLEEKNVLVIERLGYQSMKYISSATKVQPVESIFDKITDSYIGAICKVASYTFSNKRFLVLHPDTQSQFHTIILCSSDENSLDELKSAVLSAEKSLYHIMKEPKVVFGGGCFEAQVAAFVYRLTKKELSTEEKLKYKGLKELSEAYWLIGLNSIANSFLRIARSLQKQNGDCYIDTTYHHFWLFPQKTELTSKDLTGFSCCCGSFNYDRNLDFESAMFDNVILSNLDETQCDGKDARFHSSSSQVVDSLYLKRESISSAFELSNTVLRVGCCLKSHNS